MSNSKMKKHQDREARKNQLMKLSSQRTAQINPPTYNFKESDLLDMKQKVSQLVQSNNALYGQMKEWADKGLEQKVLEAHALCRVLLKILADKGIVIPEDIDALVQAEQLSEEKLTAKADGSLVEAGDSVIMSLTIFDTDGTVVENRSNERLTYLVGSKQLPCDDDLVGMHKLESRYLDIIFGEGFHKKELIGKPLRIHLTIHEILIGK